MLNEDTVGVIKCVQYNKLYNALKTKLPITSNSARVYKCFTSTPEYFYLPSRITQGMISAALKFHDQGLNYPSLITELNTINTHFSNDVLIQISHIARVCSGAVVVRTQQVWVRPVKTGSAFQQLPEA